MNHPTPLTTTTPALRDLISRSLLWCGFLLALIAWFALSQTAQAVDPPPDGGYPGNNTAEGTLALFSLTTGGNNTADGAFALYHNTTGDHNTVTGSNALYFNTTGSDNTANGAFALQSNTTGGLNTANGVEALAGNTSGTNNTATGFDALLNNTTGNYNTASGVDALHTNTDGFDNTADGVQALYSNTTGYWNTASGVNALYYNTSGYHNTANGLNALLLNTAGHDNTATGYQALSGNTSGSNNIALGASAGANLTTGSNNIEIGAPGVAGESSKIRIGKQGTQKNTYIAGIFGATVATGVAVRIDSSGHLGTLTSSARFKEAIKPMDEASEAILKLDPVTFRYKHDLDPDGIPQFGLIAEEVEKVNPDLVARDAEGEVITVRYEAVNAMLLNEFLKEHRKVEKQDRKVQQLQATAAQQKHELDARIAQQQKQIEALTAAVQKVSNQLELSKPAAQMANN